MLEPVEDPDDLPPGVHRLDGGGRDHRIDPRRRATSAQDPQTFLPSLSRPEPPSTMRRSRATRAPASSQPSPNAATASLPPASQALAGRLRDREERNRPHPPPPLPPAHAVRRTRFVPAGVSRPRRTPPMP